MNERQIFEAALDITDSARREAYLSQACGADAALRARVDALLAAHAAASQFLETPAVEQLNMPPDTSGDATLQLPPSHVAPPGEVAAEMDSDGEIPQGPDLSFLSPSSKTGSIGTLGHYEILKVLGQGAFGIVFKAFDEKLHRHVAIKTMSVPMAATSPARKRFLREARAAAAIRHENVVQVYSVEEQPIPYLVMEYIDGETLQQKQRNQGPLEVPETLHLVRQIASGLAAAHSQSLIHRDVKPGNILLERGAEQKVKITDFGLARAADDASLTRSGMISGTPLYMSPEQAFGQSLDHRSDLFSLGSVMYELITGRPPFRAPNTVAVLKRVVDDTPRPIHELIPETPDWLIAIVNQLLAKKPDERFQSAKEVADLLARCQSELQLTGQVTCVPPQPASPARAAGSASARSTPDDSDPTAVHPPLMSLAGKEVRSFKSLFWIVFVMMFTGGMTTAVINAQTTQINKLLAALLVIGAVVLLGRVLSIWKRSQSPKASLSQTPSNDPQRDLFWWWAGIAGIAGVTSIALPMIFFDTWPVGFQALPGLIVVMVIATSLLLNNVRRARAFGQRVAAQDPPVTDFSGVWAAHVAEYNKRTPQEHEQDRRRRHWTALMLGVLLMFVSASPFLAAKFGRYFNSWIWPAIPTLPQTALTAGLNFDGKDDHVEFAPVDWSYPQFTIEAFVTSTLRSDNGITVSLTSGGKPWEIMELYDGPHNGSSQRQSGAQIMGKTPYATAYGPLTPGVRQHRALVFDGSHMHYYINGIWQGKRRAEAYEGEKWKRWNLKQLRLGSDGDGKKRFEGQIDQVRISKVARYNDNFAPVTSVASDDQTLAQYDFAQGSGDVLKDISGNGHDGKIVGATWVKPMPADSAEVPLRPGLKFATPESHVAVDTLNFQPEEPLTLEAWVTAEEFQPTGYLSLVAGLGPLDLKLNPSAKVWEFLLWNQALKKPLSDSMLMAHCQPGRLAHLCGIWNPESGLSFYVDGKKVGTSKTDLTGNALLQFAQSSVDSALNPSLVIGGLRPVSESTRGNQLIGIIHEMRVSRVVRYQDDFVPAQKWQSDPNTIALYDFAQGSGDLLKDISGNGHDGKISGATWVKPASVQQEPDGSAKMSTALDLPQTEWTSLFDGTSATGWQQLGAFQVINGILISKGGWESAITEKEYADFELEAEWKVGINGDGGVFYRELPTQTRAGTVFSFHDDVGLTESHSDPTQKTASLYGVFASKNPVVRPAGEWNKLRIVCRGSRVEHWLNDSLQLSYDMDSDEWKAATQASFIKSKENLGARKGHILLRSYNTEVAFRRIRIREYPGMTIPGANSAFAKHWPADAPAPAIAPFSAEQAQQHQAAWAKYLGVPVEYTNSIGMKFRLIPPGEFLMGSTSEEIERALKLFMGEDNYWPDLIKSEAPQHKVILTQPIYLGINEVTQAEYEKVMGVNPSYFAPTGMGKESVAGLDTAKHPVEMVMWSHAAEFCAKLSQQENLKPFYFLAGETITPLDGTGYRLPTEAEWEYACRAGTTTKYWIDGKDLERAGWFKSNSGGRTHAAGELKANPYGLFDIHGNVWEWVADGWEPTYYGTFQERPAINPNCPRFNGSNSMVRGGSWYNYEIHAGAANRRHHILPHSSEDVGFRVALPVDAVKKALSEKTHVGWHGWPADAPAPAIAPFTAEQAKRHQEAWAAYLNVPVEYTNSIGMKFRLIPPGEFLMGSTATEIEEFLSFNENDPHWKESLRSETPQRPVRLSTPFYLGTYEVTQSEYQSAIGNNPSHFQKGGLGEKAIGSLETSRHPVESLNWNEAASFCEKLGALEKIDPARVVGYRLPTEREWEFACRAGTTSRFWSGDTEEALDRVAWTQANSDRRTHAVGELESNPLGLFDMHGNVWEWVHDRWVPTDDSPQDAAASPQKSPQETRLLRGGDIFGFAPGCRSSHRYSYAPEHQWSNIGFRVVLSVDAVRQALKVTGSAMPQPVVTDPDRDLALWVLSHPGGLVDIDTESGNIASAADLPTAKFSVEQINFSQGITLSDADCELIGRAKNLRGVLLNLATGISNFSDHGIQLLANSSCAKSLKRVYISPAAPITDSSIEHFNQMESLQSLELVGSQITDSGVEQLRLKHLERLALHGPITTRVVESLAKHSPMLSHLALDGANFAGPGIEQLSRLPLQSLNLSNQVITNSDLLAISRVSTIRELSLGYSSGFDGKGLEQLSVSPRLDSLRLYWTGETTNDSTVSAVSQITTLEELQLGWTGITDTGIQHLTKLPKLRHVGLQNTEISDFGLGTLQTIPTLRRINLEGCKNVTAVGVNKLQTALPECEIVSDYSTDPDRDVALWILSQTGRIAIFPSIGHDVTAVEDLPASPFVITAFEASVKSDNFSDADLSRIGQLSNVGWMLVNSDGECTKVTEAGLEAFSQSPAGRSVFSLNLPTTNNLSDQSIPSFNRMTQLSKVILPGTQFTDEGIRQLRLPNLKELNMGGSQVTHASLKPLLENNPKLETLFLWGTEMSGPGLTQLQTHPIKALWLMQQRLTDDDLKVLAGVTSLEYLNLGDTQGFTQQGVKELSKLPNLGALHLFGSGAIVNDETVEALAEIRTLQDLQIGKCDVTDAGLKHLTQLSSLKTLALGYTRLSDAGLEVLGQIKTLEKLYVNNCENITEAGVQKLRESLPQCEIISDFTSTPLKPTVSDPVSPNSQWSAPVNLGSAINTPTREANPSLTSDELLLVFTRGEELFEARRASRDEPFAPATKLAGPLPSAKYLTSCLSGDGLQLVYSAIPPGGSAQEVMIATRTSRDEPFGQPVVLPQPINAPGEDRHPVLSPDGLILALTSVRGGQQTGGPLIFTRPTPTAEFNPTPTVDARLQGSWSVINSFSSDGRGLLKTTMADNVETITWHTRTADSPDWSEGQPLPAPFDAIQFGAPFLSTDGNTIYFHSRSLPDGQGELDLWVSRRTPKTP